MIVGVSSIKIIQSENVGVKHLFGKVSDVPIYEGLHLKSPLTKIETYNGKTQEYTMVSAIGEGEINGVDSISALTSENLEIGLDVTILYRIDRKQASEIWKKIGTQKDVITKIIRPIVRTRVRDIVSQYTKDELNKQRPEVANKILLLMKDDMNKRGIIIEDVLVRKIVFPSRVQDAINEKEEEKEKAGKMEFTIITESKEKERKRIEAQGIADANEIIANSITDSYLKWYWIESIKNNQNVMYVPIGNDGIPIFKNIDNNNKIE